MDIKEIFYNLGKAQAENGLPLAFVDINSHTFSSTDRTKSLNVATGVTQAIKGHIVNNNVKEYQNQLTLEGLSAELINTKVEIFKSNLEVTRVELFEYMYKNHMLIVEGLKFKGKEEDINKQFDIELMVSSLDPRSIHYVYNWNADFTGKQPVPDRIVKRVEKDVNTEELVTDEVNFLQANILKFDIGKNKVTAPRTKANIVAYIPLEQAIGYVNELMRREMKGMVRLEYRKVNGTNRSQYITADMNYLLKLYRSNTSLMQKYYDLSIPNVVNYMGYSAPRAVLSGAYKVPDVGLSIHEDSILRRINLGAITEIEYINDMDHPAMEMLAKYIDVNLTAVHEEFTQAVSTMQHDDRLKLWDVLQTAKGTPNTELKEGQLLVDEIMKYINYYIMFGSTTAKKHLHTLMIENADLFPGYAASYSTVKQTTSIETQQFGTLDISDDILGEINF